MKNKLTTNQEAVCQEYVLNGNNQSAAYRKGYPASTKWKPQTVHVQASKFFKLPKVLIRVEELQQQAAEIAKEKFNVDAEYVLRRLVEIDQMDVADILDDDGSMREIRDWPLVWRNFISGLDLADMFEGVGKDREMVGVLKKIKWPDKIRNLELLGKHVSVSAFKEHHELTGKDGAALTPPVIVIKGKSASE